MLETFFELHPSSRPQGTFLFFNEIQEVPNWDIAAQRIVDTEKITMYVTGSSSRMLSTDVATEFRGRSIAYELMQASLSMKNEATRQREVSALQEAMARFEKNAATIITLDEESNINVPEGMIHVVPAWKWLLG